jgi:tetratricopeptide (TPR) repeat protein
MAIARDGSTVVAVSDFAPIQLRDATSGRLLGQPLEQLPEITAVALSPDAKTILTGSFDNTARISDAVTGKPVGQPMAHSNWVMSVAFSSDGRTILTGSEDGTARLWDAVTGEPIGQPLARSGRVSCVVFSPDGRMILTGGWDNTARLWDATTLKPNGAPFAHAGMVMSGVFSPDGRKIVTGCSNHTARLWDAVSGQPLGQPLPLPGFVTALAFSPDGRTIVTGSSEPEARFWDVATGQAIGPPFVDVQAGLGIAFSPDGRFLLMCGRDALRRWDAPVPLPGDVPRLAAWVAAVTGLELVEGGAVRVLDSSDWQERRRRLEALGGPPPVAPTPRFDPILFGANPTARGAALAAEGLWKQAEAAYRAAARARPLNVGVWRALALFLRSRGHRDRTAATWAEAVRLMPANHMLRIELGLALLEAGDHDGWRRTNATLLDRFDGTTNATAANNVAWACAIGPDGSADPERPVRLAETAVRGTTNSSRPNFLNTLGATLYRAGRFDEAIRRLEEGIKLRGGASTADDWAFLAMAHSRLEHRAEALRWLERVRDYHPSANLAQNWSEVATGLVCREAEVVVLYDPAFPEDPFAR